MTIPTLVRKESAEAPIKWQKKFYGTPVTTSVSDITQVKFSNLEIGKTYRASLFAKMSINSPYTNTEFASILQSNGAQQINYLAHRLDTLSDSSVLYAGNSTVFVATATTLVCLSDMGGTGNIVTDITAILEELPNHEETTDWT